MTTYTAFTTLSGEDAASALGEAMELLSPVPTGVGVFEIEDGSGNWEIGGYFVERPDVAGLALLATIHSAKPFILRALLRVILIRWQPQPRGRIWLPTSWVVGSGLLRLSGFATKRCATTHHTI